jgi:hypothetical protein
MRIKDLCESVGQELDKDVKHQDKHGLGYDLVDDLLFFMHHDDDAYRRHTYPSIMKARDHMAGNKPTDMTLFSDAVNEAYEKYRNKFHEVRALPEKLDEETLGEICSHMHEHETKKIQDGHYED